MVLGRGRYLPTSVDVFEARTLSGRSSFSIKKKNKRFSQLIGRGQVCQVLMSTAGVLLREQPTLSKYVEYLCFHLQAKSLALLVESLST